MYLKCKYTIDWTGCTLLVPSTVSQSLVSKLKRLTPNVVSLLSPDSIRGTQWRDKRVIVVVPDNRRASFKVLLGCKTFSFLYMIQSNLFLKYTIDMDTDCSGSQCTVGVRRLLASVAEARRVARSVGVCCATQQVCVEKLERTEVY